MTLFFSLQVTDLPSSLTLRIDKPTSRAYRAIVVLLVRGV